MECKEATEDFSQQMESINKYIEDRGGLEYWLSDFKRRIHPPPFPRPGQWLKKKREEDTSRVKVWSLPSKHSNQSFFTNAVHGDNVETSEHQNADFYSSNSFPPLVCGTVEAKDDEELDGEEESELVLNDEWTVRFAG